MNFTIWGAQRGSWGFMFDGCAAPSYGGAWDEMIGFAARMLLCPGAVIPNRHRFEDYVPSEWNLMFEVRARGMQSYGLAFDVVVHHPGAETPRLYELLAVSETLGVIAATSMPDIWRSGQGPYSSWKPYVAETAATTSAPAAEEV